MERWRFTTERRIVVGLMLAAVLSMVFIGSLVAPPKLLLGRALTAIAPNLFPLMSLGLLALLCAGFLFMTRNAVVDRFAVRMSSTEWKRGGMLFAMMTFYALTMEPFGFYISSALSMAAVSWLTGNRSIPQILAVSLVGPPALYLVATRLLSVSLPELSTIEFAYARLLGG